MTRKSRREIERAQDDLIDTPEWADDVTDADLGVTADFVTYEATVNAAGPEGQFQTVTPATGGDR